VPDDDVYPNIPVPTPPRDHAEETWKLESLIGSRVLLGAGLVSLLAGTVFFVKLSNDHQWIPPEVRIVCGIIAGLALMIGGAWRLGKERTLIAEGVTGLGASVLYLSLWGAFGPFHLLHYGVAFAAMVAVSAALALVAWARRSQNVALVGLAGGYLTPLLLLSGPFDRVVLAIYLAVLCGAMLALAVRCRYRFVEAASFGAALLYAPVFAPSSGAGDVWTSNQSLLVASVLFAEFAIALFAAARRETSVDRYRLALLAGEVLAYGGVLEFELRWNPHSLAIADAALAAVLLAAVAVRVPAAMRSAYAWLGIGILTRAVEAFGGGHALTGAIAVEGAGLVYVSVRGRSDWSVFLRRAGYVLLGAAVVGAIVHLVGDVEQLAVLNLRTFAAGVVVLSLLGAMQALREHAGAMRPWEHDLGHFALVGASVLGVWALTPSPPPLRTGSGPRPPIRRSR
jgi:uncharacterized membrane protein